MDLISLSPDAVRAHREEDTPGEPTTDPARLAEILGFECAQALIAKAQARS